MGYGTRLSSDVFCFGMGEESLFMGLAFRSSLGIPIARDLSTRHPHRRLLKCD